MCIRDSDCMVVPWMMDADQPEGDYMLYALLNGGAAYLNCEAEGKELEKEIERCLLYTSRCV